jgi:hypothetical protein
MIKTNAEEDKSQAVSPLLSSYSTTVEFCAIARGKRNNNPQRIDLMAIDTKVLK